MSPRTDPEFFDAKYRANPDPWRFDTDWYEIRKRKLLMALLPDGRYRSALEPGCATGHLTQELASRCDHVLATDIAPRALQLARHRCENAANITFRDWALGDPWSWDRKFDLIVLSEVAYYLPAPALDAAITELRGKITTGTTVVLSHWRHDEPDHYLTGDQANEIAVRASGQAPTVHYLDADVRIDIVTMPPNR